MIHVLSTLFFKEENKTFRGGADERERTRHIQRRSHHWKEMMESIVCVRHTIHGIEGVTGRTIRHAKFKFEGSPCCGQSVRTEYYREQCGERPIALNEISNPQRIFPGLLHATSRGGGLSCFCEAKKYEGVVYRGACLLKEGCARCPEMNVCIGVGVSVEAKIQLFCRRQGEDNSNLTTYYLHSEKTESLKTCCLHKRREMDFRRT